MDFTILITEIAEKLSAILNFIVAMASGKEIIMGHEVPNYISVPLFIVIEMAIVVIIFVFAKIVIGLLFFDEEVIIK